MAQHLANICHSNDKRMAEEHGLCYEDHVYRGKIVHDSQEQDEEQ